MTEQLDEAELSEVTVTTESGPNSWTGDATGGDATAGPGAGVRDDEAVGRFIERFALLLEEAGMQRMAARVFVALLATDSGRLTAAELADRLAVSPAAISGAVRYLSQTHLVTREREQGSRRDFYRVYDDAWYHALTQRDALIARWEVALDDGIKALDGDTPAGQRVAETREYMAFVRQELVGIGQRWEERQRERSEDRSRR